MATLSPEQLAFLENLQVPLSLVFEASGLDKVRYTSMIDALGSLICYGVSPCRQAGHTLRTRGGHCVQCKPHNLVFLRRYDDAGWVYVLMSRQSALVKIGTTTDLDRRVYQLNEYGYGGFADWECLFSLQCGRAGRVEFAAQHAPKIFGSARHYERFGVRVECRELFAVEMPRAIEAVKRAAETDAPAGARQPPRLDEDLSLCDVSDSISLVVYC